MTQGPGVAANPALRTIGLLACGIDLTAIVTTAAFRLRLKMLRSKGSDEQFAEACEMQPFLCHIPDNTVQNVCNSRSGRCLATASPLVLIARYAVHAAG